MVRFRRTSTLLAILIAAVSFNATQAQQQGRVQQSEGSPSQRIEVMRSRLEEMRRTLNSAISAVGAGNEDANKKEEKKSSDSPRARLRGLEREVASVISDVSDIRGKQERAERYDASELDKLETSVKDLDERVQSGLRATAGERRAGSSVAGGGQPVSKGEKKKKRGLFGRLLGRGGESKYEELVGAVAPGRDRELFEEAALQARKGSYETARLLFDTIVSTYPESPFLPLAKLAKADTFYREGTSSALIQSVAGYRDWLTFFPTDPLADDVMLKMAEAEMRQMGLPDRDISHARKAEQQLRVIMQQFPGTSLAQDVEVRLREVQENLGTHDLGVANFYYDRYLQGKAPNPKGAQSRLREIVEKYPNFSYMDEVLYKLGSTYVLEEEPDEAAKYFQRLAREHPNSEYAEKGIEQLEAIGASKPDPDPKRKSDPPPVRPSFSQKIFREVLGTTPVTINKSGVLIGENSKGGDLIEEAIRNGGILPVTTPTAPVNRRAPSRLAPAAPLPSSPATSQPVDRRGGVSVQPTQPGPPVGTSNPTNLPGQSTTGGAKP